MVSICFNYQEKSCQKRKIIYSRVTLLHRSKENTKKKEEKTEKRKEMIIKNDANKNKWIDNENI